MLTSRQLKALQAVRVESDMASMVGATHFYKGQLGAGIGWTVLDQLHNAGLIEYSGKGSDRQIAITDAGRVEADRPLVRNPANRRATLPTLKPRIPTLPPRLPTSKR